MLLAHDLADHVSSSGQSHIYPRSVPDAEHAARFEYLRRSCQSACSHREFRQGLRASDPRYPDETVLRSEKPGSRFSLFQTVARGFRFHHESAALKSGRSVQTPAFRKNQPEEILCDSNETQVGQFVKTSLPAPECVNNHPIIRRVLLLSVPVPDRPRSSSALQRAEETTPSPKTPMQ